MKMTQQQTALPSQICADGKKLTSGQPLMSTQTVHALRSQLFTTSTRVSGMPLRAAMSAQKMPVPSTLSMR